MDETVTVVCGGPGPRLGFDCCSKVADRERQFDAFDGHFTSVLLNLGLWEGLSCGFDTSLSCGENRVGAGAHRVVVDHIEYAVVVRQRDEDLVERNETCRSMCGPDLLQEQKHLLADHQGSQSVHDYLISIKGTNGYCVEPSDQLLALYDFLYSEVAVDEWQTGAFLDLT